MRVGRVVAILATAVSLAFATAFLFSAGGCSGSSGSGPEGVTKRAKLLQERMKENKEGKSPIQVPKKK